MAKEDIEKYDEEALDTELTKEQLELLEIGKEQSVKTRNGQVEFNSVNHSERAEKFGRVSDGDTTKYVNIALEYFGHRCALSGERFTKFDGKVQKTSAKSNLSAEHVVALCLGGDDIVPNLVPTVLQYNLRKNGYYLLDYWDKQKDTQGKSLYSPYRLLKLVNYMMKSIEARDLKSIKDYRKAIMTPNEIDGFLAEIEKQDELETDNSKKKIHSDTITATTADEDNKKILTEVPQVEGNIPTQREQQERFRQNEIDMMDIFLSDAVGLLNRTQELQQIRLKDKDGNEIPLQDKLDDILKTSIGVIPFEVEVRNAILEKLETLGVQDNKYSVANDLLNNTPILEMAKENRDDVKSIVEDYIESQLCRIRDAQILTEEQLRTIISNMPTILYNENDMNKIRLWSTYRQDSFEELISRDYTATDTIVDVLIVLKTNGIDLAKIVQSGTIEDLIKEKDEEEQNKIIKELQEISEEIKKDWPIGTRLNTQKTRNMDQLKKEIDKTGMILTLEEQQKILEKQEQMSRITTKEFVKVLVVLKTNGIDLSKVLQGGENPSTIEDLIKEKDEEEQNKIIKELQEISEEITIDWNIGARLNTQKTRNIDQLKKEINKAGIILTVEEECKILEKQEQMSGITTREFVQVLVVLKEYKIDLSKIIVDKSTIEDLIKEKDEEEQNKIIKELQEISEEIKKDWPIGTRLDTQKTRNIAQLKKEIDKAGIILTPKEQKKILEKESSKDLRERTTRELVQVLVVLKTNGIDLSKVLQGGENPSTIEDLIKEKDEEEQNKIIKELQEISEEIKKDWPIGVKLKTQKKANIDQLKKEINKAGIKLTVEEECKILEKQEQMSGITTREFVQVLVVLKEYKIDLSKIVKSSKIKDLIKEKDEEEQNKIIKELQEISEEIKKDWPIGTRLDTQKTRNITQLKKEIDKAGIILASEEQKKILEKEGNKERSERAIREFVQVLVALKTNGIDLSKIVQNATIEDLIREKDEEEKNKIVNELQEISEEIKKDWPIGTRLNTQKTRNMDQLKKEMKKARIELTEEERKKLLETRAQKKVKQTVVEQKNKGELGQNQQIEAQVFEETIRQAEQTLESEVSAR